MDEDADQHGWILLNNQPLGGSHDKVVYDTKTEVDQAAKALNVIYGGEFCYTAVPVWFAPDVGEIVLHASALQRRKPSTMMKMIETVVVNAQLQKKSVSEIARLLNRFVEDESKVIWETGCTAQQLMEYQSTLNSLVDKVLSLHVSQ